MPDANITKRALASALKEIVRDKPFAKISVGEVCELCGMNRKSFYYHFRDKYELVNWIYNTEFLERMVHKEYETSWEFLLDTCVYFADNRPFYISVFEVTGQNSFREYYAEVFGPLVEQSLSATFETSRHQQFFSEFFTDAFLIALEKWLRDGNMSPREFVALLQTGVEGAARHVVTRLNDPGQEEAEQEASPEG